LAGHLRGHKVQFSVLLDPRLLSELDEIAASLVPGAPASRSSALAYLLPIAFEQHRRRRVTTEAVTRAIESQEGAA